MPPTGRFLLDTNVIIALFARDAAVIAGLTGAEAVFVPAVALGELYFGARKSRQSRENLAKITDFAARSVVIAADAAADAATAAAYGELKAELPCPRHADPRERRLDRRARSATSADPGVPRRPFRARLAPHTRQLELTRVRGRRTSRATTHLGDQAVVSRRRPFRARVTAP